MRLSERQVRRLYDAFTTTGAASLASRRRGCGGRMVVLATIDDPAVIHRILTHLGLSTEAGEPLRGRAPPWTEEAPA